jgi:hypothetical protein
MERKSFSSPRQDGLQSSDTDSSFDETFHKPKEHDAKFDHTLAMRKSAPRGGTWKFSQDNLSVEIPLGPVTLFSDKSVSIHDTQHIVWTFKVEPVKITRSERIRRERYCFGLVPENQLGDPGFLLVEEGNPCRMEGGYPMPGKLHTVMISPVERKIYFFMDNLGEKKFECIDIPPELFPCRLGILAFMHQTIEIVNDLHPVEFYIKGKDASKRRLGRTFSGGGVERRPSADSAHSQLIRFLSSNVPCFRSESVTHLRTLCDGASAKSFTKGDIPPCDVQDSICIVIEGSIVEVLESSSAASQNPRAFTPGEFFQEQIFIAGQCIVPRKYQCISDSCSLLVFSKDLMLRVFPPSFLNKLIEHANTISYDLIDDPNTLCGRFIGKDELSERAMHSFLDVNLAQLLCKNVELCDTLTVLSLTKCNIHSIDFSLIPITLKNLYLGFNHLDNLDKCNFSALKTLNLAQLFLHCNSVEVVPKNVLKHMTSLQELGLDSNHIKNFDLTDLPKSLLKLWLSNNSITILNFKALVNCPLLSLFDLSFNEVRVIEADTWPSSLVHFYVAGNGIENLDIRKLPRSLQIFDIGGSDVTMGLSFGGRAEVASRTFHNVIQDLDMSLMERWDQLRILDIAHNNIDRIEEKNIPQTCIALFAAQNQIKTFKPKFLSCQGLQILDLSNNVSIEIFDTSSLPPALRILNLYNNALKVFDTQNLPPLKTLWLGKNKLTEFVTSNLPTTLKILSLTSNQLTSLDFKNLPPGLDVLNVNNNRLTELNIFDLPRYLQQLEFKNNSIKHFDWNDVAKMRSLMSLKFDQNDFLIDVNEAKVLAMFQCILSCPNLTLKPDEFSRYLAKFRGTPESLVGTESWISAGLPVPCDETLCRDNWRLICRYMIAVSRSGGARRRSHFSVVYVPLETHQLPDLKKSLSNASSMNTPRIVYDADSQDTVEILRLSRYELSSRFIMSYQRVCVLTLVVPNVENPVFNLSHVFACLQCMYHALAHVSVIVLVCNESDHDQPLDRFADILPDIEGETRKEIQKLNNLAKCEMRGQSFDGSRSPPPDQSNVMSDCSMVDNAIENVESNIAKLKDDICKRVKLAAVPSHSDNMDAAELFWEDVRCRPELVSVHREAEKLWKLHKKLISLKLRSSSFSRTFQSPHRHRNAARECDLLHLSCVLDFCDFAGIKAAIKSEVSRQNEFVPAFYETVRSSIAKRKDASIPTKSDMSKGDTVADRKAMCKADIVSSLKGIDTRHSRNAQGNRQFFRMGEIPEPDLWEAVRYSSSLGYCFVINNFFFPDAGGLFLRYSLADVFKRSFLTEKNKEFEQALKDCFDDCSLETPLSLTACKNLARKLWLNSDRVFTLECTKYLSHWKAIETEKDILRDCVHFFEDCGVLVPFFSYTFENKAELHWQIARESFAPFDGPEQDSNINSETMQAFYVFNVSPISQMSQFWTSLRYKTREADHLLTFASTSSSIMITRESQASGCRIVLQNYPACFPDPEGSTSDHDSYNIRSLSQTLSDDETNPNPSAIVHVTCPKRDSALFRFCIEGLEKVLKLWYPDFRNHIYISCYVPELTQAKSELLVMSLPLSRIFDQNAHKSILASGNASGNRHLPVKQLFPRTCSIFFSHVFEGDGTSHFTDMLKDHLERRFICSVWYDKNEMDHQSEFFIEMQKGLKEASNVIICLTPLYLTRPNCLRELKWALELADYYKSAKDPLFKVLVLALHPSVTYAGRQTIRKHQCVILPKNKEYGTPRSEDQVVVHMLSDHALKLLEKLDQSAVSEHFIDAMPWRSDYDDWSLTVPEIDLSQDPHNPQPPPTNVAQFFKVVGHDQKSVHALMDSYCDRWFDSLTKPPMISPLYAFGDMKTDDLHSNPRSLGDFSEQANLFRLDIHFDKFLQKDESHFRNSIFGHKDMYLLILIGLSSEQLIFLMENPIGFRDPGVGNRMMNIDKWLRRGALLALSRDFSSTLSAQRKDQTSKAVQFAVQAFAQSTQHRLKKSEIRDSIDSRAPEAADGFKRPGSVAADPLTRNQDNGLLQVMHSLLPNLNRELQNLNETQREMRSIMRENQSRVGC